MSRNNCDPLEKPSATHGTASIRSTTTNLLGGLAGTGVALPQSMALGVVLFTGMGFDASTGALAGLLGAALLSLVSGIGGATIGMISAPNGPVTMLLTSSLATIAATGVTGEGLLVALVATLVLMGLFQFLLGVSGGGQLIKFIPYPAVAGIVTGIGLLMILSQIKLLFGISAASLEPAWFAFPGLVALVTFTGIKLGSRVLPAVPGIISGLLVGTGLYHLALLLMSPTTVPESWVVGEIPSLQYIGLHLEMSSLADLPWKTIVTYALILAILASVDCLLTAVVADGATGERHNARRELAAQGIGQVLAGLLGGMGGGGTKGATLVAITAGGRRWSALASSATFIMLILFLGPVGLILPISVLAGVIICVVPKVKQPFISISSILSSK